MRPLSELQNCGEYKQLSLGGYAEAFKSSFWGSVLVPYVSYTFSLATCHFWAPGGSRAFWSLSGSLPFRFVQSCSALVGCGGACWRGVGGGGWLHGWSGLSKLIQNPGPASLGHHPSTLRKYDLILLDEGWGPLVLLGTVDTIESRHRLGTRRWALVLW